MTNHDMGMLDDTLISSFAPAAASRAGSPPPSVPLKLSEPLLLLLNRCAARVPSLCDLLRGHPASAPAAEVVHVAAVLASTYMGRCSHPITQHAMRMLEALMGLLYKQRWQQALTAQQLVTLHVAACRMAAVMRSSGRGGTNWRSSPLHTSRARLLAARLGTCSVAELAGLLGELKRADVPLGQLEEGAVVKRLLGGAGAGAMSGSGSGSKSWAMAVARAGLRARPGAEVLLGPPIPAVLMSMPDLSQLLPALPSSSAVALAAWPHLQAQLKLSPNSVPLPTLLAAVQVGARAGQGGQGRGG